MGTKRKIRIISLMLFAAFAAVWAAFYAVISQYIVDGTRAQIAQAAYQVIERLGSEFSQAERLSNSLTRSEDVIALLSEDSPDAAHALCERISRSIGESAYNPYFVENIVLFSGASYYRLIGELGNKSCSRLAAELFATSLPSNLSVELNGVTYIGYADRIVRSGAPGAVAMLIEEEKLLEIMSAYDQGGDILIAVRAEGGVIAANTDNLELFASKSMPVAGSRLGITPFEILVTAKARYLSDSVFYFTVVALITAAIFGVVLAMYSDILNRRFFRPMVKVIGSIGALDAGGGAQSLEHVQSAEFDGLIDKINEMLINLESKNSAIKNAEVDKQKALIISLKKQINAHFILSTLNIIRILGRQGELDRAEAIAADLMGLVRYAHHEDELINIWSESEILQKYIDIMNSRYDGKLTVEIDFDERLMEYRMPRMLLQPIVENSITHGFKGMSTGCIISIKAGLADETVRFSVRDNGCGMSSEELLALNGKLNILPESARGVENIALLNIKNRLYHYYGDAGRLTIGSSSGSGTLVAITIPLTPETGDSI